MTGSSFAKLSSQERIRGEILGTSDRIPPLPDLVVRLLALLGEQSTEPQDLEDHLRNDPVLVAKILGLVNSPFYGRSHAVKTIKDAVMVLGFRGLRSLLLATGTAQFLQSDCSCYGHDDVGLWKHSIAVAASAKSIAKAAGLGADHVEEMFVAGLLHDIGKMLLSPYMRKQGVTISAGQDVLQTEQEALGIDHAETGGLVADKWNLSPLVQDVLRHHHGTASSEESRAAVAVVRIADAVAHELGVGFQSGLARTAPVSEADLAAAGLDSATWTELRATLDETVQTALTEFDGICG